MKPQKIYCPWGLGPRNYIWATRTQKTYPAISPEPWIQFSETRPHFFNNHEINVIKFLKPQKIYCHWGLGPRNYIWATRAQKTYPAISPEPWLQFSQTRPHFLNNHEINVIKS